MFLNTPFSNLYPRLAGLPLAGRAIAIAPRQHPRSPTLSRRELRRLIADMVD